RVILWWLSRWQNPHRREGCYHSRILRLNHEWFTSQKAIGPIELERWHRRGGNLFRISAIDGPTIDRPHNRSRRFQSEGTVAEVGRGRRVASKAVRSTSKVVSDLSEPRRNAARSEPDCHYSDQRSHCCFLCP